MEAVEATLGQLDQGIEFDPEYVDMDAVACGFTIGVFLGAAGMFPCNAAILAVYVIHQAIVPAR